MIERPRSSINKKETPEAIREKNADHILQIFPQGDALVEQYAKKHEADPHSVDVMRDVLYTALDEAITNSAVYHSEKFGDEFPYTRLSIRELASKLYASKNLPQNTPQPPSATTHARREFITTGIPVEIRTGGQFEWIEVALSSLLESLPTALQDMKESRETEDSEVYILGYPTNEYGTVSPELNQALKTDGLAAFGKLYAEFIEKQTQSMRDDPKSIIALTGISLGGSISAEIGSDLLQKDLVSQAATEKRTKPRLIVGLHSPANVLDLNTSPLRKPQVAAGFLVGVPVTNALTNPGAKTISSEMPEFLDGVRKVLADKMTIKTSAEQKAEKLKAIQTMLLDIGLSGTPLPTDVRVTETIGVQDPIIYSAKREKELEEHEKAHPNSLGKGLLSRNTQNARMFGVRMSHQPSYYRESEFRRYDRIVRAVDSLTDSTDS